MNIILSDKSTTAMRIIILALSIVFMLRDVLGQQCTRMDYYGCTVCYSTSNGAFTFNSCKKRYCQQYATYSRYDDDDYYYDDNNYRRRLYRRSNSRYDRDSRNSNRRCIRYAYYSYSEEICLNECCGNVGLDYSYFNESVVNKCYKQNKRLQAQLGIILGCVFGGIFLLVASFIFYKWRKDHS